MHNFVNVPELCIRVRVQIKSADKDMMDDMHKQIKIIIESKQSAVEWEHFLNGTVKTHFLFRVLVRALHRCIAEHILIGVAFSTS